MYDSEKSPKHSAVEAEEVLNEDDNGHIILESNAVKAIEYVKRKRPPGIMHQWIYSRNSETVD